MENSLVTICITTYNRKELLPLTLKSILNQTYKNIEVLIIDDYSTDGTKELIEDELLKLDDRIKYIRHRENKGLAKGRNTAINAAKGKYFTFCDDDDEWESNYIEEFVLITHKYDDSWCFYCGTQYNNILQIPSYEGSLKTHIKNGYTPPVAAQFYFLDTLKRIKGYNINIKSGVDHDLWLKLSFENINVRTVEKCLSIPNANANAKLNITRMTTNKLKRINGISESLQLWKHDIIKYYDKDFYEHFYNSYFNFLYYGFFVEQLKNRQYINLFSSFIKIKSKTKFIKKILKHILLKKICTQCKYIELKPTFEAYDEK